MNRLVLVLLLIAAAAAPLAAEPQASEATVRELLAATQSRKMLDALFDQLDESMQAATTQAFGTLNAEQQRIMDDMRTKTVALFKKEMSWEAMEPMIVDLYKQAFTESEVRGMLDFYRSPAGKAVITKMPGVMQSSMQTVQARMGPLMEKLQKLQQDTAARMKAAASE